MASGIVKWFNAAKGYGFISPDQGGRDIFVHYSGIAGQGYREVREGDRVEFTLTEGKKGPQAVEVSVVTPASHA